ncbi:MAG: efflux RND transporter periplasmic adaptor subunit [Proteobacteria bacterium]|nr:efflux RND transporter periplasmic adaptor subunit [Cystobacterineae bacterium]MCL2258448.1 efflux RND transporter periplasmic adaptor subunit [Cystobacterineae bacterium]MCL2315213.1 efflux RND transporter periplasmic adaptor subunit [Pseudomonadota bacterium]
MKYTLHLCFASFILLNACTQNAPPTPQPPAADTNTLPSEIHLLPSVAERVGIRVGVAQLRSLSGGMAIPAEAQLRPNSTAHVWPLVSGRLTKVVVSIGEHVKQGQLLGIVASTDVSAARSRLNQLRARLSAAEAALRRQQQLSAEGIGAQRSLIEAQTHVAELKAEADGLRSQLSVFGSGSGGELSLLSPIEGLISTIHATVGEIASPEQIVFTITNQSQIWVRGNVPELEINRLVPNSEVLVRFHAFPETTFKGTIHYIEPSLDAKTRSLPIWILLENPEPKLRSGLFGNIELLGGQPNERVLSVPIEAIASMDGQPIVFTYEESTNLFRPQPVTLGRRAGSFFEVLSGLQENAPIALSGTFTLKSILKHKELMDAISD